MGIFYDNSKKISYEEMYGQINETNEINKKNETNKVNEIEIHREILTKAKEMKEMKEKNIIVLFTQGFIIVVMENLKQ